jgi:hypothetical protein
LIDAARTDTLEISRKFVLSFIVIPLNCLALCIPISSHTNQAQNVHIQRKCVSVSSHVPLDALITVISVTVRADEYSGWLSPHCHLLGSASPSWQNELICDSIWNKLCADVLPA